MNYHYICTRETTYNGRKYRPGYPWLPEDGGDPPEPGGDWTIQQEREGAAVGLDGPITGSATGAVFWAPQPGRPAAAALTPEEAAILEEDPYGLKAKAAATTQKLQAELDQPDAQLDDEAAAPPSVPDPPALNSKKPKEEEPTVSFHSQMSQEEIDDPYGLKSKAAATTQKLQAELDEQDGRVDPPDKEKK